MLSTWVVASLTVFSGPAAPCQAVDSPAGAEPPVRANLEELYRQGRTYIEFRDAAERRVEAWNNHYAQAQVPDAVLTRLAALPGTWHLLVVAEDWCGDSANTIPYVAKLDDAADNLTMRIIDSDVGRAIMEAHLTPDGRTATPTVILLTEDFEEAGCFVERPRILQDWWLDNEGKLEEEDRLKQKYAWYDEDQGRETLKEIVDLIEAASEGRTICGR